MLALGRAHSAYPDQWQAVLPVEPGVTESIDVLDTKTDVGPNAEAPGSDKHEGVHRDDATEPNEAMAELPTGSA